MARSTVPSCSPRWEEPLQDPEGFQTCKHMFDAHTPSGEFCVEGLRGGKGRCSLASLDRAQQALAFVERADIGLNCQERCARMSVPRASPRVTRSLS